jgi:hypothetical protein
MAGLDHRRQTAVSGRLPKKREQEGEELGPTHICFGSLFTETRRSLHSLNAACRTEEQIG